MVLVKGPRLYTLQQVADLLNVSRSTVRRAVNSGELRAVQFGRGWQVRPAGLQAYVDRLPEVELTRPAVVL